MACPGFVFARECKSECKYLTKATVKSMFVQCLSYETFTVQPRCLDSSENCTGTQDQLRYLDKHPISIAESVFRNTEIKTFKEQFKVHGNTLLSRHNAEGQTFLTSTNWGLRFK